MKNEFFTALEELEEKRGISKAYMLEKVEQALVNAFKREEGSANVRVHIDENKGEVKVYKQLNVVETVVDDKTEISLEDAKRLSRRNVLGGVVEIEMKTKNFGRISAQTAKQV
ncbi:MAG: transcription termination/antitermination protein NusA, partial [Clostridia bacterium]|nr:transcription termination/antitermination protein NusA [Clostridia bacterium]